MSKRDKIILASFAICLLFFLKGTLYLTLGYQSSIEFPQYKPIVWLTLSIWNLMLCILWLLIDHIMRTEENIRLLAKRYFYKIQFYVASIFCISILIPAILLKNTLIIIFGLTVFSAGLAIYILTKKQQD